MILQDVEKYRALCLELAVSICKETGNTEAIVDEAEKYWQWLNGEKGEKLAAVPNLADDDIPF
jgi:hypothetical protein